MLSLIIIFCDVFKVSVRWVEGRRREEEIEFK